MSPDAAKIQNTCFKMDALLKAIWNMGIRSPQDMILIQGIAKGVDAILRDEEATDDDPQAKELANAIRGYSQARRAQIG